MPGPITIISLNARGAEVKKLHSALAKLGLTIPRHELDAEQFGVGTRDVLLAFQKQHGLKATGALDEATQAGLEKAVAETTDTKYRVEGRILFESGVPAGGLALRLYDRGLAGRETKLGESKTDERGYFAIPYDALSEVANVEIRAVDATGKEIALSATRYGAAKHEVLNLVAPESLQRRAAEYQRLTQHLAQQLGTGIKLADAREDAERRDFTILSRATGWDARLIALAATAQRVEAETGVPHEALYALFRAGLPTDKRQLAHLSTAAFDKGLAKAQAAGLVDLRDRPLAQARTAFENFTRKTLLAAKAPGAASSFEELFRQTGLPPGRPQRKVLEDLFFTHRGTPAEFWKKLEQGGIEPQTVDKLKLQGKLAALTHNNVALLGPLQAEIGSPDKLDRLADLDLFKTETWKARITAIAGEGAEALAKVIPPAYAAKEPKERLELYAADLARKVRLSFPTRVVARMVEKGELRLAGSDSRLQGDVHAFLANAEPLGFALGRTPVSTFIKDAGVRAKAFQGIAAENVPATTRAVKRLQRLYQITPTNEALQAVSDLGFGSAHEIASLTRDVFLERFGGRFVSRHEAELTYRKAQQVSAVTYSFFTAVQQLASAPPVYGISPTNDRRRDALAGIASRYPTMETLFGSLDFCECEHCRSVLSPAAYLVDLLQFLDPAPTDWAFTVKDWNDKHPGQTYSDKYKKPIDALLARRPDLAHLPLTCENTNTVLPYIDIVNEILEYYMAHGQLTAESGHDTGTATSAELLAEPQNVLPEAYDKLREARYPLNLPFDLWIETVRRFCNYFEAPLDRVLETFRKSDALLAPAQPFDRAGIFMESLGLSPTEIAVFTDPNPLQAWHTLYGYQTETEATAVAEDAETGQRIDLNSAKALSRRLGVTYKEMAEIVQTGFVNPKLAELVLLDKLNVVPRDARLFKIHKPLFEKNKDLIGKDRSTLSPADQLRLDALSNKVPNTQRTAWETVNEVGAFELRLKALAAAFNTQLSVLQANVENLPSNKILELADPDTGCNFDLTTLQYADGRKADPIAFLRLNLFVRLWRKLGWSIEETDRALSTFIPRSAPFDENPANLAKQPLKTALIYLSHLKALDEKVKVGKQSRLKLLTLWSDIATTGKKPLYAQLFLTRSVLKTDPVFDHPLGQYLTDPNVKVVGHMLALEGALGLTADEIGRILADAGKSPDAAELSLPNVSLLYRYGLLAKALKLPVCELIALKQLSGLDPFKLLGPDPLATIEEDHPFSQTLRFVEIAEEVKGSGLKIEDLEYLLHHRFDETGKYRPSREGMLALLKTLSEGIRAIRTEHAVPVDPGALSEETLRQKLGLALPPDVVDRFLAMMNGTAEFTATRAVASANQLHPTDFVGEPAITQLTYNETKQEQKLVFRGVLFDEQKAELKARFNTVLDAGQQAVFAELLDAVQAEARQQADEFFVKHLKKQLLNSSVATGFLDAGDFDVLVAPLPEIREDLTEDEKKAARKVNEEQRKKKLTILGEAFFPFLQQRLIRQFIVQSLTAHTAADPVLVESLVTDDRLLASPMSVLGAVAATAERGVTATFFATIEPDPTDPDRKTVSLADADTGLKDKDGKPLKPAGASSARLEGYLEVPTPGAYRFTIELDKQNAEAELRFDHLADPVFLRGSAASDNAIFGDQPNEFLELKPGIPYRFILDVHKLNGGEARLLVQGETLPKDRLAQLVLYPLTAMEGAERAVLLLTKALQLVQGLGLSEREIRYLLTHAADFEGLSLSELPTRLDGNTPEAAQKLFKQFLRLAGYCRLKRDLAGSTDDLVAIFDTNGTGDLDKVYSLIAKLTRRDEATVKATAEALFGPPAFVSEQPLQRLWEALQIVERFGVPVASVREWTGIVNVATTPEQRFEIARDLKEAIKARFEPEAWQRVSQSIFDTLRQRQRDALVAHLLHTLRLERVEQLYEHFLVDPGTEPVVQTSRLRLAISSVQLFIQRCLLNLEHQVPPSVVSAERWEWMKRYRVWEANRKILLFPENWLEPEFRDDKSHLFKELEGALLQGDVTRDVVEDAFFQYLKNLEELARLEIVATCCEERPLEPGSNTLHVVGRTGSQPHKYFYRRYANRMWTPWEPVPLEIESDLIAIAVWRERVHLFWVTPFEKPEEGNDEDSTLNDMVAKTPADLRARRIVEVQLNWSELYQGQWTTRTSSGFGSPMRIVAHKDFDLKDAFIHVSKEYEDGEERGIRIHLHFERASLAPTPGQMAAIAGKAAAMEAAVVQDGTFTIDGIQWHLVPGAGAEDLVASAMSGLALPMEIPTVSVDRAFRVVSQNSPPEVRPGETPATTPYASNGRRSTCHTGANALKVSYLEKVVHENDEVTEVTLTTADILRKGDFYMLLFPSNATQYPSAELAPLVSPFFYQDQAHAFFVEPWLREITVEKWEGWVLVPMPVGLQFERDEWWQNLELVAATYGDDEPCAIDASALYKLKPRQDWLTDPGTVLHVGKRLIGRGGGLDRASLGAATSGGLHVVGGAGSNRMALRRERRS